MIVCAGAMEQFSFAKSIGIGLVQTAINLTKILIEQKPEEIVFIGSFGLYKDGKIGDIIQTSQACNIEISSLLNCSYSPLLSELAKGEIVINSSNYITTSEVLANTLFQRGVWGENMEVFSVFEVAKKFEIKAKAVLVATNYCNEFAHQDFIKNHKFAMNELIKYLENERII